jgi:PTS system nitrogen regulatory IIA component
MRICEVLNRETILTDMKAKDKKEVLEELVDSVSRQAGVDRKELVKVLMERERLGSTGIGGGIAIPHGKLKNLESLILNVGVSHRGVDFESIDNRPAHIFFLLITPENSTSLHLKILARISKMLKNEIFKEKLLHAAGADEIFSILKSEDEDF